MRSRRCTPGPSLPASHTPSYRTLPLSLCWLSTTVSFDRSPRRLCCCADLFGALRAGSLYIGRLNMSVERGKQHDSLLWRSTSRSTVTLPLPSWAGVKASFCRRPAWISVKGLAAQIRLLLNMLQQTQYPTPLRLAGYEPTHSLRSRHQALHDSISYPAVSREPPTYCCLAKTVDGPLLSASKCAACFTQPRTPPARK